MTCRVAAFPAWCRRASCDVGGRIACDASATRPSLRGAPPVPDARQGRGSASGGRTRHPRSMSSSARPRVSGTARHTNTAAAAESTA